MKWTKETLKEKLSNETIQDGECGKRGFEIARLLTGQTDTPTDPRPKSVDTALELMRNGAKEGGIVISWFESGYTERRPVQHCYFVFDDTPVQSFTIWRSGLEFLDEATTRQKLVATIERDGEVGIHVYPMNIASPNHLANLPASDSAESRGT